MKINKDTKIMLEIYRRAFAASTPIGDFDKLMSEAEILDAQMLDKVEPKQETLEEAAEIYVWGGIYLNESEKQQTEIAFIEGAKWQQERMYSEEDLRNAYRWGTLVNQGTKEHFNEWFEQFKKIKV